MAEGNGGLGSINISLGLNAENLKTGLEATEKVFKESLASMSATIEPFNKAVEQMAREMTILAESADKLASLNLENLNKVSKAVRQGIQKAGGVAGQGTTKDLFGTTQIMKRHADELNKVMRDVADVSKESFAVVANEGKKAAETVQKVTTAVTGQKSSFTQMSAISKEFTILSNNANVSAEAIEKAQAKMQASIAATKSRDAAVKQEQHERNIDFIRKEGAALIELQDKIERVQKDVRKLAAIPDEKMTNDQFKEQVRLTRDLMAMRKEYEERDSGFRLVKERARRAAAERADKLVASEESRAKQQVDNHNKVSGAAKLELKVLKELSAQYTILNNQSATEQQERLAAKKFDSDAVRTASKFTSGNRLQSDAIREARIDLTEQVKSMDRQIEDKTKQRNKLERDKEEVLKQLRRLEKQNVDKMTEEQRAELRKVQDQVDFAQRQYSKESADLELLKTRKAKAERDIRHLTRATTLRNRDELAKQLEGADATRPADGSAKALVAQDDESFARVRQAEKAMDKAKARVSQLKQEINVTRESLFHLEVEINGAKEKIAELEAIPTGKRTEKQREELARLQQELAKYTDPMAGEGTHRGLTDRLASQNAELEKSVQSADRLRRRFEEIRQTEENTKGLTAREKLESRIAELKDKYSEATSKESTAQDLTTAALSKTLEKHKEEVRHLEREVKELQKKKRILDRIRKADRDSEHPGKVAALKEEIKLKQEELRKQSNLVSTTQAMHEKAELASKVIHEIAQENERRQRMALTNAEKIADANRSASQTESQAAKAEEASNERQIAQEKEKLQVQSKAAKHREDSIAKQKQKIRKLEGDRRDADIAVIQSKTLVEQVKQAGWKVSPENKKELEKRERALQRVSRELQKQEKILQEMVGTDANLTQEEKEKAKAAEAAKKAAEAEEAAAKKKAEVAEQAAAKKKQEQQEISQATAEAAKAATAEKTAKQQTLKLASEEAQLGKEDLQRQRKKVENLKKIVAAQNEGVKREKKLVRDMIDTPDKTSKLELEGQRAVLETKLKNLQDNTAELERQKAILVQMEKTNAKLVAQEEEKKREKQAAAAADRTQSAGTKEAVGELTVYNKIQHDSILVGKALEKQTQAVGTTLLDLVWRTGSAEAALKELEQGSARLTGNFKNTPVKAFSDGMAQAKQATEQASTAVKSQSNLIEELGKEMDKVPIASFEAAMQQARERADAARARVVSRESITFEPRAKFSLKDAPGFPQEQMYRELLAINEDAAAKGISLSSSELKILNSLQRQREAYIKALKEQEVVVQRVASASEDAALREERIAQNAVDEQQKRIQQMKTAEAAIKKAAKEQAQLEAERSKLGTTDEDDLKKREALTKRINKLREVQGLEEEKMARSADKRIEAEQKERRALERKEAAIGRVQKAQEDAQDKAAKASARAVAQKEKEIKKELDKAEAAKKAAKAAEKVENTGLGKRFEQLTKQNQEAVLKLEQRFNGITSASLRFGQALDKFGLGGNKLARILSGLIRNFDPLGKAVRLSKVEVVSLRGQIENAVWAFQRQNAAAISGKDAYKFFSQALRGTKGDIGKAIQNLLALSKAAARGGDDVRALGNQSTRLGRIFGTGGGGGGGSAFGKAVNGANRFLKVLTGLDLKFGDFFRRVVLINAVWRTWNGIVRQLRDGLRNIVEFDQGLKNIAAITVAIADDMVRVEQTLLSLAIRTPFAPAELAKAFTLLGQAGFSTTEAIDSFSAVTLTAIATLSSLDDVVKLLTSSIRAYGLEASQATDISNIFVAAVNNSKLTVEGLNTAFNFAGPAAAGAGLSITDTAAALGVLADNGVKASTQGTGLRQVIAALINPSNKLRAEFQSLGINIDDVNPMMHEFSTVLHNLRDAGFNTASAFRSMERRTANIASILVGQAGAFDRLTLSISNTQAAFVASETQMTGLEKTFERLRQVMLNLANQPAMIRFLEGLADGVEGVLNRLTRMVEQIGETRAAMDAWAADSPVQQLLRPVYNFITWFDGLPAGQKMLLALTLGIVGGFTGGPLTAVKAAGGVAGFAGLAAIVTGATEATVSLDELDGRFDKMSRGGGVGGLTAKLKELKAELLDVESNTLRPAEPLSARVTSLVGGVPEGAPMRDIIERNLRYKDLRRQMMEDIESEIAATEALLADSTSTTSEFIIGTSEVLSDFRRQNLEALRENVGTKKSYDQVVNAVQLVKEADEERQRSEGKNAAERRAGVEAYRDAIERLRRVLKSVAPEEALALSFAELDELLDQAGRYQEKAEGVMDTSRQQIETNLPALIATRDQIEAWIAADVFEGKALAGMQARLTEVNAAIKGYSSVTTQGVASTERLEGRLEDLGDEYRRVQEIAGMEPQGLESRLKFVDNRIMEQRKQARLATNQIIALEAVIDNLRGSGAPTVEEAAKIAEAERKIERAREVLASTNAVLNASERERTRVLNAMSQAERVRFQNLEDFVRTKRKEIDLINQTNRQALEAIKIEEDWLAVREQRGDIQETQIARERLQLQKEREEENIRAANERIRVSKDALAQIRRSIALDATLGPKFEAEIQHFENIIKTQTQSNKLTEHRLSLLKLEIRDLELMRQGWQNIANTIKDDVAGALADILTGESNFKDAFSSIMEGFQSSMRESLKNTIEQGLEFAGGKFSDYLVGAPGSAKRIQFEKEIADAVLSDNPNATEADINAAITSRVSSVTNAAITALTGAVQLVSTVVKGLKDAKDSIKDKPEGNLEFNRETGGFDFRRTNVNTLPGTSQVPTGLALSTGFQAAMMSAMLVAMFASGGFAAGIGAVVGLTIAAAMTYTANSGNFPVLRGIQKALIRGFVGLGPLGPVFTGLIYGFKEQFNKRNIGRTILSAFFGPLGQFIADIFSTPSFTAAFLEGVSPFIGASLYQAGVEINPRDFRSKRGGQFRKKFRTQTGSRADAFSFEARQDLVNIIAQSGRLGLTEVNEIADLFTALGVGFSGGGNFNRVGRAGIASSNVALLGLSQNLDRLSSFDIDKLRDQIAEAIGTFNVVIDGVNQAMENFRKKGKGITADQVNILEASIRGAAFAFADDFPKGVDVASKAIRIFRQEGKLDMKDIEKSINQTVQAVSSAANKIASEPFKKLFETGDFQETLESLDEKFASFIDDTIIGGFEKVIQQQFISQGILTPLIDQISELQFLLKDGAITVAEFGEALRGVVGSQVLPQFSQLRTVFDEIFSVLGSTVGLPLEKLPDFFGQFEEGTLAPFLKFGARGVDSTVGFRAAFAAFSAGADTLTYAKDTAALFGDVDNPRSFAQRIIDAQATIDEDADAISRDAVAVGLIVRDMVGNDFRIHILNTATNLHRKTREDLQNPPGSSRGIIFPDDSDEFWYDIGERLVLGETFNGVMVARLKGRASSDDANILAWGDLRSGLEFTMENPRKNTPIPLNTKFTTRNRGLNIDAIIERGARTADAKEIINKAFDTVEASTGITREAFEERARELADAGEIADFSDIAEILADPERIMEVLETFGGAFADAAARFAAALAEAEADARAAIGTLVAAVTSPEEFIAAFSILKQAQADGLISADEFELLLYGPGGADGLLESATNFKDISSAIVSSFNESLGDLLQVIDLDSYKGLGDRNLTVAEELISALGLDIGDQSFQEAMTDYFDGEYSFREIISDFNLFKEALIGTGNATAEEFEDLWRNLFAESLGDFEEFVKDNFDGKSLAELTGDEFLQAVRDYFGDQELDLATIFTTEGLLPKLEEELPDAVDVKAIFEQNLGADGILDVDQFLKDLETAVTVVGKMREAVKASIMSALKDGDVKKAVKEFSNSMKRTVGDALIEAFTNAFVNQIIMSQLMPFMDIITGMIDDEAPVADIEAFMREHLPEIIAGIEGSAEALDPLLQALIEIFKETGIFDAYGETVDAQQQAIKDQLQILEGWQGILDSIKEARNEFTFEDAEGENILAQIQNAERDLQKQLAIFRDKDASVEDRQAAGAEVIQLARSLFGLSQQGAEEGMGQFQRGSAAFEAFRANLMSILNEVEIQALEGLTERDILQSQLEFLERIALATEEANETDEEEEEETPADETTSDSSDEEEVEIPSEEEEDNALGYRDPETGETLGQIVARLSASLANGMLGGPEGVLKVNSIIADQILLNGNIIMSGEPSSSDPTESSSLRVDGDINITVGDAENSEEIADTLVEELVRQIRIGKIGSEIRKVRGFK